MFYILSHGLSEIHGWSFGVNNNTNLPLDDFFTFGKSVKFYKL